MNHHPTEIALHKRSRVLAVSFEGGEAFELPFEYLRVFSPSAEVRGHGPGQEVLVAGKKDIGVSEIQPVGGYAIRIVFSDGHSTGIFSWDVLHRLGRQFDDNWRAYLGKLNEAGLSRNPG